MKVFNKIVSLMIPLLSAVAVVVFTVFCMANFKSGFLHDHADVITSVSVSVEILYVAAMVVFRIRKTGVVYKFLLTGLVLAAVILVGLFILQETGVLDKIDSQEALQDLIESTGVWGPLVFIVLQALQVFLLPIPGVLTVGAGVFLFGPVKTCLYSYIGIVGGSMIAFWIGRVIGYKAASWLVGRDALDSWLHKVKGKDRRILTAMFVLPVFPDDVLCFVAGLSTMTWKYFIVMQLISRGISVVLTSFSVGGMIIPYNTWWGILCWGVIGVAIILLFVLIYKKGDAMEAWFFGLFGKKKKAHSEEKASEKGRSDGAEAEQSDEKDGLRKQDGIQK